VIYLYYGPDDFSIREAVQKQLKAALPAETADLNLTRLAADQVTPDALRFACEAAPFLADRRAVVVERFFSAKKTTHTEAVADYLPRVPVNTLVLFVEEDAPPKTGLVAKALAGAKVKQQFFGPLTGAALARWIRDRAKAAGGQITDPAAQLLASFVGGDLRTLSNEIAKLVTYVGPGKTVGPDDVRLLVNEASEANIWALVDGVGRGQLRPALAALHQLVNAGERPERIMGMVARQVRLLVQARDCAERRVSDDETGKTLGVSGFQLRKVQEQARAFTLERLRGMHERTLKADLAIKTGRQPAQVALELLVTDLAAKG
jgi:DNA polymerase-3 subunit delta